jgi:hypothetical protein
MRPQLCRGHMLWIEKSARGHVLAPARNPQILLGASEKVVYVVYVVHIEINILGCEY